MPKRISTSADRREGRRGKDGRRNSGHGVKGAGTAWRPLLHDLRSDRADNTLGCVESDPSTGAFEIQTMIEQACDLWLERADYRCIPATGAVANGEAVMDAGVALEAAEKYPSMPADLGRLITSRGNHVHEVRPGIVSFPIKQYAWQGITIPIVRRSAQELATLVGDAKTLLACPPLGDGDPSWEDVAAALSALPDNVIVIRR